MQKSTLEGTLPIHAVLFDLDGTLLDTAADLTAAANALVALKGGERVSCSEMRSFIAKGARGILWRALGIDENHESFKEYSFALSKAYEKCIARETRFFAGMDLVLDYLDQCKIPWGIVTNKPTHLTTLLVSHFKLHHRLACLVCGDTLPKRKPEPDQLLLACDTLNCKPETVLYVGDTKEDVEAARAAGVKIAFMQHGYTQPEDDPQSWCVDWLVEDPREIIETILPGRLKCRVD